MSKKSYHSPQTDLVQVCQSYALLLLSGTGDPRLDLTDIIGYDGAGPSFDSDEAVAARQLVLSDD